MFTTLTPLTNNAHTITTRRLVQPTCHTAIMATLAPMEVTLMQPILFQHPKSSFPKLVIKIMPKNVNSLIPEGTQLPGGHSHPVAGTSQNAPHSHSLPWGGNAPHSHTANINQSNAPHSHSLTVSDANAPHVHNTDATNNNPVSTSNSGVEL